MVEEWDLQVPNLVRVTFNFIVVFYAIFARF